MTNANQTARIITKENVPWLILVSFFFVLSFVLVPMMQEGNTFLDRTIFFGYLAGTTILARYIYTHHYKKIRMSLNFVTLLYIPLLFGYMTGVEMAANTYRLFEPGFLYPHLKFHIFDDTLVIVAISLAMWGVFQRFQAGKETLIVSFLLGAIFQSFFASENGFGIVAGLLTGPLWIWIFHFPWFYTSLLVKNTTATKET